MTEQQVVFQADGFVLLLAVIIYFGGSVAAYLIVSLVTRIETNDRNDGYRGDKEL